MTTAIHVPVPTRSNLRANLACVASMLIWALGFPLGDELLKELPPMVIAAGRTAFATVFLLPLWYLVDGRESLLGANWRAGLLIGAIGFGVGSVTLIFAQSLTDGITVSVILATMPLAGIALECLLDGRRLGWRLLIGVFFSLVGGIAVYALRMGTLQLGIGAVLALVSVSVFAWGSRASVISLPGLSAIGRSAITLTGAGIAVTLVLCVEVIWTGQPVPWASISAKAWFYLIFHGVGSMALAQVFFIAGVAGLGVGIASMHMNIAPFYVMIFSLAFGVAWNWWQVLGAAVVVLGVIIAQSGEVRRAL